MAPPLFEAHDGRVIFHCDLDYFFAQCEELRRPELKGRPLVVCVYSGRTEDSGAVSTANYEARKYGVRSGMPIARAKKLLKEVEASFLPVDKEYYEAVSERVMAILREDSDAFEQLGLDEAFLEVTERVGGSYEGARALALRLKERIKSSEGLTCSIGIGPNKLVAKMASSHKKPDGLTLIEPHDVQNFLKPMPVGKLYMIGKKSEAKLLALGIRTIGDLAKADPQLLEEHFGKRWAEYMIRAAKGIDYSPVEERKGSEQLSRIVTLKEDSRDPLYMAKDIERIAGELQEELKERRLRFRTISILAIMDDMSLHTKSRTFDKPQLQGRLMVEEGLRLLVGLLKEHGGNVRRIGMRVSQLSPMVEERSLTDFLQG